MEPSSIPSQYGGTLDFKWGDLPVLDDAARELAGGILSPAGEGEKPQYLKGPMRYLGDRIEVLGTDQGKPRRQTIPTSGSAVTNEQPASAPAPAPAPAAAAATEAEAEDTEQSATPSVAEPVAAQDPSEKLDGLETTAAPVEAPTTTTA